MPLEGGLQQVQGDDLTLCGMAKLLRIRRPRLLTLARVAYLFDVSNVPDERLNRH